MKWIIVISVLVSLLALQTSAASREKKPEKRPTKKASSAKPTKTTPKSIVEEFNGLPPEDIDFIKELDKQFNELGNKIKIKVQRDNSSDAKSTKRTIDGDLGYGHYSNQHEGGYHFSKPKYMLYPYAQHHTGHLKATHSTEETVTELEITPSHSYELKPIEEVYQVYPDGHYHQSTREQQYYEQQQQHHHHQQQQEDDTPTIVLKIPGPAKYAQHLKALLQQYLEVRAAQLYKEIQEQEYQHQQHAIAQQQQQLIQQQQQHEHHQQQQQQQQHYHQHHHGHQHQAQHVQPTKYSQPDPYQTQEVYVPTYNSGHGKFIPVHGHYYESPRNRPTQPTYRKPVAAPTHVAYHSTPEPEHEQQAYEYETYHQSQAAAQHQHHHQHQHQPQVQVQYQYVHQQAPTAPEEQQEEYVYQKPMVNFVTPTPDHDDHQEHYQQPPKYQNFAQYHAQHKSPHQEPEDYLPEPKLVENYPSDKHTRVVYKSQSIKAQLQQASEEQPEYAAHHQQDHQEHDQHDHQQQYIYQAVYPSQTPYLEKKAFIEPVTPEAINDLHSHGSSPEPEIESPYETEPIVAITQKPKTRLYNYHANTPRSNSGHRMHATRSAGSGSGSSSSGKSKSGGSSSSSLTSKASSKRDAPYTEEQFKKINKMVHRMKKKQTPSGAPTTTRSVTSTNKSQ